MERKKAPDSRGSMIWSRSEKMDPKAEKKKNTKEIKGSRI